MAKYIWQNLKWPQFVWDGDELLKPLGAVRRLQGELLSKADRLGLEARVSMTSGEAVMTAAIEGENLDRLKVRSSVARRLGLSTAGLPSVDRNCDGLVEMLIDATHMYDTPMTEERLLGWHGALFPTGYSGMYQINVGKWRKGVEPMQVVSGRQGREKIHYEAPPSKSVKKDIKKFLIWLNTQHSELDGLIKAAIAHLYFITIHPFEDGNGRIARALTDYVLAVDEGSRLRLYSMSAQINKERDEYYKVLEQTQKGTMNITNWLKWFLSILENAIIAALDEIEKAMDTKTFWERLSGISLNQRQTKVINRLLEAGPDGFKGGLNNRKYVGMTKVSRETAKRDLGDLVKKGVLIQKNRTGRSVSYSLDQQKN